VAQRGIDIALDLSRMPALARHCGVMPIPGDILEAMKVAAREDEACRRAALAAGAKEDAIVDAARFYLQHLLFSAEADCYRVLGLAPGASRATARLHMKLLLKWLHPDRNGGLESIYAERVIQAWRDLADRPDTAAPGTAAPARRPRHRLRSRPPLLEMPPRRRPAAKSKGFKVLTAGLLVVVAGVSATYYFAPRLYEPLFVGWKP